VLLPGHPHCLRCGQPGEGPPVEPRLCPVCGLAAGAEARFCAGCGQSVQAVGRVVTTAFLHDPPRPPDPARVWVERRPSVVGTWPAAVLVAVTAVLLAASLALGLP
jgi:predicted amidophosphoribosyltransferase